jgi:hypothetical protein
VWAVPVVHTCKPVSIAVYPGSRIHIQCDVASSSSPPITYFALPNASSDDIQRANQAIAVASTAQAAGKPVGTWFGDNGSCTSHAPWQLMPNGFYFISLNN